jgi:hypothetical protein
LLVHICRRWRCIAFGSCHLNLQLFCTPRTPFRDTLDTRPAFPLHLENQISSISGVGNIIASLEHRDRIYKIKPPRSFKFAVGRNIGRDAGAVPGPDGSTAWRTRPHDASRFRFVLGWICTTSANSFGWIAFHFRD